ncbi:Mitotic checkpoint protein BUB3 [Trichuris trichiura]|uniref:Mitotic checkpoint protein BUB3 n=1 Tax=Trichuris trichiura TaxID=36087 RepID=A0A077ZBA4_TRITR|nr:Mitotic checkpoint protein BUB3 [Trichuris trichiura]
MATEPHIVAAPNEHLLNNAPSDGVTAVHFSPESEKFLLASSWDSCVRLYELSGSSANYVRTSFMHEAPVLDCIFTVRMRDFVSANQIIAFRTVVTAAAQAQIPLLNTSTWSWALVSFRSLASASLDWVLETILGAHEGPVRCLSNLPNLGLMASGSWDQTVKLWDPRAGRCVGCYNQPQRVYSMDACGDRLIVATAERKIWVWDLRSMDAGPEQQRESPLKFQTRCLRSFPNELGFAVSSIEGRVAVEFLDPDYEVQKQRYVFKCHRSKNPETGQEIVYPVLCIAFHPVHGTFATGGSDGMVNIWDPFNKKRLSQFHRYPTSVISMEFSHDGTYLAIACSYQFECPEKPPNPFPIDSIYVRKVVDSETSANALLRLQVRLIRLVHSELFFAVPIRYTASLDGYPDLPSWIDITSSPKTHDAYLFGNPRKVGSIDVLVIGLNRATYTTSLKRLRVHVVDQTKTKYKSSDQRIQLLVANYDAWQFFAMEELLKQLQAAVVEAFPSRTGSSTIYRIQVANLTSGKARIFGNSIGVLVTVAPLDRFTPRVSVLGKDLLSNPTVCKRNVILPWDAIFAPRFKVDWCRFRLWSTATIDRNLSRTMIHSTNVGQEDEMFSGGKNDSLSYEWVPQFRRFSLHSFARSYFRDWVVFGIVPGAILLFIILVLSSILFGCREGQHWRDYKTPRIQLMEYVSLRRSQRHLRQLTLRRLSSEMVDPAALYAKPVGKQTVQEAAMLNGGSCDLYYEDGTTEKKTSIQST